MKQLDLFEWLAGQQAKIVRTKLHHSRPYFVPKMRHNFYLGTAK